MVRRAASTVSQWTTVRGANASCTLRRSPRMLRAKFAPSTSISTNSSRNSLTRSTLTLKKINVLSQKTPIALSQPSNVSGRKRRHRKRPKRMPFRPNYPLNFTKNVKQRKLLRASIISLGWSANKWRKNRNSLRDRSQLSKFNVSDENRI